MPPGKGAGYTPLDLESNVSSGQWRTIEEHERLQQEGAVLSTTATDSPESSGPEFADFYGQQRQQISSSRKKIAWIVGGGSGLAWPLVCGVVAPAWLPRTAVAFVVLCAVVASAHARVYQLPSDSYQHCLRQDPRVACAHSHGRADTQ